MEPPTLQQLLEKQIQLENKLSQLHESLKKMETALNDVHKATKPKKVREYWPD